MWPWEHLAAGYLAYSLGLRSVRRPPPTAAGLLVVVLGTQLPDLVDKPLSWGLGWFAQGYAVGHSVFLAAPLSALVLLIALRRGRGRLGVAFAVGHWSHLATDVLDPLRYGRSPDPGRVLWPIVTAAPYPQDLGMARGLAYLAELLTAIATMGLVDLFVQLLLLPLLTFAVWLVDGAPGARALALAVSGRR